MATQAAQLKAALLQLETLLKEGQAELKKNPAKAKAITTLHAELKKLSPGQSPPAKVMALVQAFLAEELEAEMKEQQQLLDAAKGPHVVPVSEAHRATLRALTLARDGLSTLDPQAPANVRNDAVVRSKNANDAAEAALEKAEAAILIGKG